MDSIGFYRLMFSGIYRIVGIFLLWHIFRALDVVAFRD